jgi:hypothetical protein
MSRMDGDISAFLKKTGSTKWENSRDKSSTSYCVSTKDQSVKLEAEQANNGQTCNEHKKTIDIYCLDCEKPICTSCALFGMHRVHLILIRAIRSRTRRT